MATAGQRGARSKPNPLVRLWRAFRALSSDQRLCGLAALSLLVTMFLPWYDLTGLGLPKGATATQTAFGAFSVIEANVLIFALGVLALLFARGERSPLRMPGGDGAVIFVAGVWLALVIVYRMFDKQGTSTVSGGHFAISTSLDWGIFLALLAAIWLAFTGRALRRGTPAEPDEDVPAGATYVRERRLRPLTRAGQQAAQRPREPPRRDPDPPPGRDVDQLTFELPRDHYDE